MVCFFRFCNKNSLFTFLLSLSHACYMSPSLFIHFDLFIIILLQDFRLKELPCERQRENKSDDYFSPPDCHICFRDSLCHSHYKVLKHDFHVTKYCFSIQFLPHSKTSHFLVRFETSIVMLITTHL